MAMTGVASRFVFSVVQFAISQSVSQSVTNGENEQPGETTNPHYVRGSELPSKLYETIPSDRVLYLNFYSLVFWVIVLAHRVGPYQDISRNDNEIIRMSISVSSERSRLGFSILQ